jgi:lipoate-protein ligase A
VVQALRLTGTVAELHGRDPFGDGALGAPRVWWCDFADAAIVLGSAQRPDVLDAGAVAADGLSVVRRRSGGGAVLLVPDAVVWIDLIVPAGTPGWTDDVRASMVRAGEIWRAALALPGTDVHDGGMRASDWSPLVCFAGVGPGEVLVGGRKLVGLSQRRTRHGARIQGLVHRRALVAETARYIAAGCRPRPPLGEAALATVGTSLQPAVLAERLAAGLHRTTPV